MFKKFLTNTSGNISIMFAGATVMVLFCIAAAVDFSGSTSQKNTLQSLSDAAVLAAVTSGETKPAQIKKFVEASLAANNTSNLDFEWDLIIEDRTVRIEVRSLYETKLMGFAGPDDVEVSVLSEALFPEEVPINVALVLDRTGSMSGANMTGLKEAAAVLVNQFADYDSDTRVAVVPFSDYVNVGLSRRTESWINVPADDTEEIPAGECYMTQPQTCTESETRTETYTSDGVEGSREQTVCTAYEDDGPPVEYCPPASTRETKWNGCIGSRSGLDNRTAAYRGQRIPGVMNVTCGEEVLELTDDMTAVKARIDSLTASGNTYIPIGLINGWRMLDADRPFQALSNKEEKRKRSLILMTDGKNTKSLSDPYDNGTHYGTDEEAANNLTGELCDNVKGAGVDIWTVAYNFEDADTKTLLRSCASGASQFFDASDQASLIAAFEEIGKSLFEVRLSR